MVLSRGIAGTVLSDAGPPPRLRFMTTEERIIIIKDLKDLRFEFQKTGARDGVLLLTTTEARITFFSVSITCCYSCTPRGSN